MSNKLPLKIFIGYDVLESVAWHTLTHSILRHSSIPVAFIPLSSQNLKRIYWRVRDEKQSNDFSYTRFLTPYLSDYDGYSLYMDCDMLITCDIASILKIVDSDEMAVYVVKHDYKPKNEIKYLGNRQYHYPKKNWSSMILWNCSHPANRLVDVNYVNNAEPKSLHRFEWLADDQIGQLGMEWNWLVGEYEKPKKIPKNIHWTVGGPYFSQYQDADYADEWRKEHLLMNWCKQVSE